MSDPDFSIEEPVFIHCSTLESPPLVMDEYCEPDPALMRELNRVQDWLKPLWETFYCMATEASLPQKLGLSPDRVWTLDLHWVGNQTIQQLNAQYRGKEQPTDVLTFTLFADAAARDRKMFARLPEVQLGEIFISVEWARSLLQDYIQNDHKDNNIKQYDGCFSNFVHPHGFNVLEAYLLERVVHGWLHLLGVTHETEARYNQVIQWQTHVLSALQHRVFNASTASQATRILP